MGICLYIHNYTRVESCDAGGRCYRDCVGTFGAAPKLLLIRCFGFWVEGLGFRVLGLGFRVQDIYACASY